LTICLPAEPGSLFLYGDSSPAAEAVREAIYDGPIDQQGYAFAPAILENLPTLGNGGVRFEPVPALPNDIIIDGQGNLTNLKEGVVYYPSGCAEPGCAQTYSGQEPVSMDQMAVRFQLRPGLQWSDGAPLTADDSQYSYEVAWALGTGGRPDIIALTDSYQALDEKAVEWRGVPGLRYAGYVESFFTPLPRHAWSAMEAEQLLSDPLATQAPLGWGPYMIEDWKAGEEISLVRNPNYWRAGEGLPAFDRLVYRFIPQPEAALAAVGAGACDLLDPSYGFSPTDPAVGALQAAGQAALTEIPALSWEHLDFGVNSLVDDPQRPPFFRNKEIRQAVAQCIDRASIAARTPGQVVLDSYTPADHPLYNAQIRRYAYDPVAANAVLQANGWFDTDNNPLTPRLSLGAPGVPDGTAFVVQLNTSDEPARQEIAALIRDSLLGCGIQVEVISAPVEQVYAPGPQGPVFGRQFSLAQFAWPVSISPPCFLFTTNQIPGPYPDYPNGWGGANASGYSNPQFDGACQGALNTLPEETFYATAHQQAQAIYAEDLPVLPLFVRSGWLVARPDLCGLQVGPANASIYAGLENFDSREGCRE
jgi:peptide/nickel transport system substrate-binding protein